MEEQRLEGRFRAAHANLIHNAEMVAFMRGERPELLQLERAFGDVRQHVKGTLIQKMFSNSLTGYINKCVSVVGLVMPHAAHMHPTFLRVCVCDVAQVLRLSCWLCVGAWYTQCLNVWPGLVPLVVQHEWFSRGRGVKRVLLHCFRRRRGQCTRVTMGWRRGRLGRWQSTRLSLSLDDGRLWLRSDRGCCPSVGAATTCSPVR